MAELSSEPIELVVPPERAGLRLDQFLAQAFPDYSRVLLRKVINAAAARVDGQRTKAAHHLKGGERITIALPELPRARPQAENIPLTILYEDDEIILIDKPPGMVVHPAKGHWTGTLASALSFHFDQLSGVGGALRPGIVHRLDRDTTGVMLVAKTDRAHTALARQFEERTIEKEYFAIVAGVPNLDRDRINQPIGMHPYQREKMTIRSDGPDSRPAETFYEVLERFRGFAALRVVPKTGRTHQIRVHLASVGCAVLCDAQYGGRNKITRGEIMGDSADESLVLGRQALHARRLAFSHPSSGDRLEIEAPLPDDLTTTLDLLRQHRAVEATRRK
jgi:23S rRNA pseudouridine1911/1915/1917 synthase